MPHHHLTTILPDTACVLDDDLLVGGCSLAALAEEFGTPVYIYDEDTILRAAETTMEALHPIGARVSFAAKACAIVAILRLFRNAGLGLDVVSEGELAAGMRAGFSPHRIHLHGNYKSPSELEVAVRNDLHAVVIDNVQELTRLEEVCATIERNCRVMLRLALPLEAETHPSLMTAGRYSKFGLSEPEESEAIRILTRSRHLCLTGLHVHLGSQIADVKMYRRAAEALLTRLDTLDSLGFGVEEVSIGGGWAVRYSPADPVLSAEAVTREVRPYFEERKGVRLAVEPGRALVARSAVAVYRVGSIKTTPGGRIVAVDGGMGDNPRPALYDARYTPIALRNPLGTSAGSAEIVGRYCESGDVLARDIELPAVQPDDLIALPVSGAYQLSMASGYNLVPPPPALMVNNGDARIISRRGTIEDLLARDMHSDY